MLNILTKMKALFYLDHLPFVWGERPKFLNKTLRSYSIVLLISFCCSSKTALAPLFSDTLTVCALSTWEYGWLESFLFLLLLLHHHLSCRNSRSSPSQRISYKKQERRQNIRLGGEKWLANRESGRKIPFEEKKEEEDEREKRLKRSVIKSWAAACGTATILCRQTCAIDIHG